MSSTSDDASRQQPQPESCASNASSRFRLVQLEKPNNTTYAKGRWLCKDCRGDLRVAVRESSYSRGNVLDGTSMSALGLGNTFKGARCELNESALQVEQEIDDTISTALELVKNHLSAAVREEVDLLREEIRVLHGTTEGLRDQNAQLTHRVNVLQFENKYLRQLVTTEQLIELEERIAEEFTDCSPSSSALC